MAIDIRQLRPSALTRIINSSPLGTICDERQLYRLRMRGGYRIGDDKTVDLLKFCAWLHHERHTPKPVTTAPASYDAHKAAARERNAQLSKLGRDIGDLPTVVNSARKLDAAQNFRLFCESYFPETFHLGWSADHLTAIKKIEQSVLHGGLFALAMPRGSGKTSLSEIAAIWASLYGHRPFTCLIGSDEGAAASMLDSIKSEIENNELLAEDFPEVCFPIQQLEGIANRCSGQLYQGKRTNISWTANEIVLPNITGSQASGVIMRVAGITGRIRGMKYKHPSGKTLRPSLVIPDDPQTDESAKSLSQCAQRERIIAGAVLGLAGPGQKIAGIMPCTVIRAGDVADRILDREKNPEWNGERTRMVTSFPDNDKLWDTYAKIRAESLRANGTIQQATAFYEANRAAMDAGAVVSWEQRFNHDEASAIQHAMNLKLTDEAAFWSEYQNEPIPDDDEADTTLTADDIAAKLNGLHKGQVPLGCNTLTMFIDVQGKLLYYVVCAWEDNFTGYVIDYGTYPDQKRRYFTLRDAKHTLQRKHRGTGLEGALYAGLQSLTDAYLGSEWKRDDGARLKIDRCLIDANWGTSTDTVYSFCRASQHSAILLPSHGRYVGASSTPFAEYRKKRGDKVGHNWRIPSTHGKRAIRHVVYDTNYWKSFVHERLCVAMGDHGCLSLYGKDPEQHRQFAEHCSSEFKVRTEGRGRIVDEWKIRPHACDNHWWDGLIGSCIGASIHNIQIEKHGSQTHASKKRMKLSTIKKQQHRH